MNTKQLKAYLATNGVSARSGDWLDYEKGKRTVDMMARSPEEYDQLIHWLAGYVGV